MKTKIVSPVPVTISSVIICDVKVLVHLKDGLCYFPSDYLHPSVETCQNRASTIVKDILDYSHPVDKWVPVDIRSVGTRRNEDGIFTLDIGYLAVLECHDIPFPLVKEYQWVVVDLDKSEFPVKLSSDHEELWTAAHMMFNIMRF